MKNLIAPICALVVGVAGMRHFSAGAEPMLAKILIMFVVVMVVTGLSTTVHDDE